MKKDFISGLCDIYLHIDSLRKHMYPVSIRFGIGFGDISTDIDMDAAIGADGPAFYAARNS